MQLNKLNNQHEQYTMYGHHKNSEENICKITLILK